MNNPLPRSIELLAPARDAATAIEAIRHGADAVYMGAASHGARQQAANSVSDIAQVAEYAHRYGAKVYVTVNTIIYDDELKDVERMVWDLWNAGADALIVQDMALLRMHLPPIALHASTQCDTRTAEKARFLQDAGFSQIVLARELTLKEISGVKEAVDVPLEVFVHGALCVSYSGDCQASLMVTGRSANRGECAQVCRFAFDLEDAKGDKIIKGKHLLSLRDMNRIAELSQLLEAGASSLKIEGRLKDTAYVKNVVTAYRQALDRIIASNPELYCRASRGETSATFTPDLNKSFNRGYTPYFLQGKARPGTLASHDTPKWIGEPIGKVKHCRGKEVDVQLTAAINNGDGLGYFDKTGQFTGFRVNKAEGNRLTALQPLNIAPGTQLYRNNDQRFNTLMASQTAQRTIAIELTLRKTSWGIALDAKAEGMKSEVTATQTITPEEARTDQKESRKRVLEKTGGTIYRVKQIDDQAGQVFIPASVLTALRRQVTDLLDLQAQASYRRDRRRKMNEHVDRPGNGPLTRHDNVANQEAARFYKELGYKEIPQALELSPKADTPEGETRVMECRYCLRNELGKCLRTPAGKDLPQELYLTSAQNRFRLEFDCDECCMRVYYIKNNQREKPASRR